MSAAGAGLLGPLAGGTRYGLGTLQSCVWLAHESLESSERGVWRSHMRPWRHGWQPHISIERQRKQDATLDMHTTYANTSVTLLESIEGSRITGRDAISAAFTEYYGKLYDSNPRGRREDLHQFLADVPVPHLSLEDCELLDAEVTCEELGMA
ncbi:hypothetical protein NDU88_007876 [Pleurodeles waltl]|uniref:Uncharacterized protein n=1 Tax=Pleurodeles waltl TaxID=8319 RepID=A0AAV7VQZ0_PLEWA|nr:hypothetical protein NDU88_007876 [Pleurodeles waltl]